MKPHSIAISNSVEKDFAKINLKIFIGTWNMNNQNPYDKLDSFILPSKNHNADIIAIGMQESYTCAIEKLEYTIQKAVGSKYILKAKRQLGKLYLFLFLRREIQQFTVIYKTDSVLINASTIFKTKGAVPLAMTIFGRKFLFVTTHLIPHQFNSEERVKNIIKIMNMLDCQESYHFKNNQDVKINFDVIFFFGDLNFRLNLPRNIVMKWIYETHYPNEILDVLPHDQLKKFQNSYTLLQDFYEVKITFPPTYKYDCGSQILDSSHKKRIPSYTDRILCRNKLRNFLCNFGYKEDEYQEVVIDLAYDSIRRINPSDHKPVYGIFKANFHPINRWKNDYVLDGSEHYEKQRTLKETPLKTFSERINHLEED